MNKQYIRTLLDESIKGVSVIFDPQNENNPDFESDYKTAGPVGRKIGAWSTNSKRYLYLTRLNLNVGDYLVVEARGVFLVVRVVELHNEPPVKENDTVEYKWVVSKVETSHYTQLLITETEALSKITTASRGHHRRLAKTALLSSFPELANLSNDSTAE